MLNLIPLQKPSPDYIIPALFAMIVSSLVTIDRFQLNFERNIQGENEILFPQIFEFI